MALGARVKQVRKELRLTQTELAETIGVGQSTIASLERLDYKKSNYDTAIAQALGVSIDWLRTGETAKHSPGANPFKPRSTPPRMRTIIDALFSLSDKSLEHLEPLIKDLARLEAVERARKKIKAK